MNIQLIIPEEILNDANRFFGKSLVTLATSMVASSKASISFKKGSPETYYIVSGIVKDDRAHESKIVYKKRLEDTEEGPFSSNCDCASWLANGQCVHTCAIFLSYHIQRYMEENDLDLGEGNRESRPPISLFDSYAVTAEEYGTLIPGAHKLIGAPPNGTYSSLQYLLHNKKVVNFTLPIKFEGKLIISINSETSFDGLENDFVNYPKITYKYQDKDGNIISEISLFEHIYLYNWLDGTSHNLPNELKNLIQKIRFAGNTLTVNELILLSTEVYLENSCDIFIDDVKLSDIPEKDVSLKITINPDEKRKLLNMTMIFHDEKDNIVLPPDFLSVFTFEGGLLSGFRRKKDAYEFIRSLTEFFQTGSTEYKQLLTTNSKRKNWLDLIEYLTNNKKTYIYDSTGKFISIHENSFLMILLTSLLSHFNEQIFRYSSYNPVTREINFAVSGSTLFSGLPNFYNSVIPYGVSIFYDKNEISKWNSKVRFERRSSGTKWFDLQLDISNDDLQVIKNADIDSGMAFTSNGLVMLGQDEKSLVRFMQKYTKYESDDVETVKTDEGNLSKYSISFSRARIFELFELRKLGLDGALSEEDLQLCRNLETLEEIPQKDLPETLAGTLREYQKTGHHWLRFLYENGLGACLADDMGLGKTLQTISFIQSVYDKIDRVLVVCPVTILLNWENEIKKFSNMDMHIYHGGAREFPSDKKIILTSYGMMKREAETTFKDKHFDILVLDEVQHLKNIRSMGAFAARQINAGFRICLTGTPVENDLAEFYNIIDLAIPGIWGDLQFIRTTSSSKSRMVAKKTAAPFILRRTKKQVLSDLPDKIENTVHLDFTEDERSRYQNNLISIRNKIKNATSKKKYGEILRGLLHLRQNCLWQKLPKSEDPAFGTFESVKVQFVTDTLDQILEEGHQSIIFSQFTTYLDLIQSVLEKKNIKLSRIDGSQSIKMRQKQVDTFQSGKSEVFLISLKAGGVGLNLTAASYVFIMDPWWNPAVEDQAIDRAHRIGQENVLTVYRPVVKGTVEEKVLELQELKRQLFKDLLPDDDENYFSGKLSMKDFEHLFT